MRQSRKLANVDEFRANVKCKRQQQFIPLLGDVARKKSRCWYVFVFFELKSSDHVLCLDFFYYCTPSTETRYSAFKQKEVARIGAKESSVASSE